MRVWTLANGLKVVIATTDIQGIVSIGMFFRVGSQNETGKTNGITHLLEHMISNQFLRDCASIGGRSNALTTKEYCCFFSKCLRQQFSAILECFRQIGIPSFSDAVFRQAKEMVVNEIQALTVDAKLDDQIFQTHLGGDPLGFLPIGRLENIDYLSLNELYSYYQKYIQPQNSVLSIVGNVDEGEAAKIIEKVFANWRGISTHEESVLCTVPSQEKRKKVVESASGSASVRLLFDGARRSTKESVANALLCHYIGGGAHSQMYKRFREEQPLAYNAFCIPQFFSRRGIIYMKIVGVSNKHAAVDQVNALLSELMSNAIPQAEIECSKRRLIEDYVYKHETISSKMTLWGQQLLLDGVISSDMDIIEAINNVSSEDVQNALHQMLTGNITILTDASV